MLLLYSPRGAESSPLLSVLLLCFSLRFFVLAGAGVLW